MAPLAGPVWKMKIIAYVFLNILKSYQGFRLVLFMQKNPA